MQVSQGPWYVRLIVVLAATIAGCGGGSAAAPRSVEQLSIEQVGLLFRAYKKGQHPPPKNLKELLPLEQGYPAAVAALRQKEVVVFWGAGLADGSEAATTVLAYHKQVPETGGEVLMRDGTARTMTAEEFKAAPKAGK
ncbi:MAG: hypothetical protein P4L84_31095 [Isosphaeraceae bacterium]|nr:hypothetical protein [Isosphaeraceae bacterium]